jgi:hypothetical protein
MIIRNSLLLSMVGWLMVNKVWLVNYCEQLIFVFPLHLSWKLLLLKFDALLKFMTH